MIMYTLKMLHATKMVQCVMEIPEERMISSGRLNLVEITASELFPEGWGSGEEMFMPSAHVESTC